jgi:hypothetical protein
MTNNKVFGYLAAGLLTVSLAAGCGSAGGHVAQSGTSLPGGTVAPSSSSSSSTSPTSTQGSSPFGGGGTTNTAGGSGTPSQSGGSSAAAASSLSAVQQDLTGIDAASSQASSDLTAGQNAQSQNDNP